MNLKSLFSFLLIFILNSEVHSQTMLGDLFEITWGGLTGHPFLLTSKNRNDTTQWIIENKAKSSLWGNSTYVGSATTFSKTKEFEFSIGRTKCIATNYGRGMGYTNMGSWGVSIFTKENLKFATLGGKLFLEYNHRPSWVLGSFVIRTDYSYNFNDKHQFIKPSVGISIIYLDILYSYSIPLNYKMEDNYYKSGITLRLKYLLGKKKCEINKPKKCGC